MAGLLLSPCGVDQEIEREREQGKGRGGEK